MTAPDPYHYALIARAIKTIDTHPDQISLTQLAQSMGMSPSHFQKVFSKWVGVSPKKYQQYLTLGHAKSLLSNRYSVLSAAHEIGLSGSSRLHDLFVNWEAMTPGEYSKAGVDLIINYGWFDTPFGDMLACATNRGLCGIAFGAETGKQAAENDMFSRWPNAQFTLDAGALEHLVTPVISQKGLVKLFMMGTPLQIKVWEALLRIPSGNITTYSEIAASIGNPKAVRTVGTAVGRNPVSWLIPCHRALRKSGALGGYHWGIPVRRAMLAYESARFDAAE